MQRASNIEIGETIFISESTVKRHISSILEKLNARNKTETVYDILIERFAS